ncbi:phage tail protein I [Spongiibacter marinus]|uniref:phage tail protein I n=1 Tax=Spongiibacter marinus TaxID=354246 RepID=UPI0019602D8A|nr:phage tail P2-like protein [Spongiibacter marinus]
MSDTSLLPKNASDYELALEAVTARIGEVPVVMREVWNPDTCPYALLPWLASAASVDAWDANWTDAQKRAAIKASLAVHRRKGSIGAVKRALNAIGLGVKVQEWFNQDPPGDPYTFNLIFETDQTGIRFEDIDKILAVVNSAKSLRSHLNEIIPIVISRNQPAFATVSNSGHEVTVNQYADPIVVINELVVPVTEA